MEKLPLLTKLPGFYIFIHFKENWNWWKMLTQDFKQTKSIKQAFTLGSDQVNNIGLDFLKKQNQQKTDMYNWRKYIR